MTLMKKISKDFEVVKITHNKYGASNNTKEITWCVQGDDALCLKVRRLSDKDDWMCDYSAGCYYDTIKSAINYFIAE